MKHALNEEMLALLARARQAIVDLDRLDLVLLSVRAGHSADRYSEPLLEVLPTGPVPWPLKARRVQDITSGRWRVRRHETLLAGCCVRWETRQAVEHTPADGEQLRDVLVDVCRSGCEVDA